MATQGLLLIEFSEGGTHIVPVQGWAFCAAKGLGISADGLYLHEVYGFGYPRTHTYEKDGNKVKIRSMNDLREL